MKHFKRPNGDIVTLSQVAEKIISFIQAQPYKDYSITVGTDSQNHDRTKIVEVISVHRIGSGGIYFYCSEFVSRISDLRTKIHEETNRSLELSDKLLTEIEKIDKLENYNITFAIHCDIGHNGNTNQLIPEIVGWVQSMGYTCNIKPYSSTASGIANRYSK
jgi:predicted RNase H-related nuclease YkuK (DUF458 family)